MPLSALESDGGQVHIEKGLPIGRAQFLPRLQALPIECLSLVQLATIQVDAAQVVRDQATFVHVTDLGPDLECMRVMLGGSCPIALVKVGASQVVVRRSGPREIAQMFIQVQAPPAHLNSLRVIATPQVDGSLEVMGVG